MSRGVRRRPPGQKKGTDRRCSRSLAFLLILFRKDLQSFRYALDLNSCKPDIALHSLELLPSANFHDFRGLDSLPKHLSRKARSERMKFDGRKPMELTERPEDL